MRNTFLFYFSKYLGMVSLANSIRKAAGFSTLGFLNPLLYGNYSSFIHDVTQGNNKCTSVYDGFIVNNTAHYVGTCCSQGFYAAQGWDPVTGLGSLDVAKFLAFITPPPPTFSPTIAPTASQAPTHLTGFPTMNPTDVPSCAPSLIPSQSPTYQATQAPTLSNAMVISYTTSNVASGLKSIASDAVGQNFIVGSYLTTFAWLSRNTSGTAWYDTSIESSSNYTWTSVTSDSSGQYLNIGSNVGSSYYSLNGGSTWQESTLSNGQGTYLASSSNGEIVLAGENTNVFLSTNFGAVYPSTATATFKNQFIQGIASDASGKYFAVAMQKGSVFVSNNNGATLWTPARGLNDTRGFWTNIIRSQTHVIVGGSSSGIYYSDDGGFNFATSNLPNTSTTYFMCGSTNLQYSVVYILPGGLMASRDYGVTWLPVINAPNLLGSLESIACNENATRVAIATYSTAYIVNMKWVNSLF